MFQSLGHHPVIGSYQQERKVNAGGTCQHGVHKTFMTWHIYKTNAFAGRDVKKCVAQFNRHTALLFFRQAVGVDPCERLDQRSFAMVNVSSSSDDHAN